MARTHDDDVTLLQDGDAVVVRACGAQLVDSDAVTADVVHVGDGFREPRLYIHVLTAMYAHVRRYSNCALLCYSVLGDYCAGLIRVN